VRLQRSSNWAGTEGRDKSVEVRKCENVEMENCPFPHFHFSVFTNFPFPYSYHIFAAPKSVFADFPDPGLESTGKKSNFLTGLKIRQLHARTD
jgi:hypothetical protein